MSEEKVIRMTDLIAPSFYFVCNAVDECAYTFFKLPGGRGSCKSSTCGIIIPKSMMQDAISGQFTNAIVYRRYGTNLAGSVYAQIQWGINQLGVGGLWKSSLSPLSFTYLPTGQKILFKGADKEEKSKSIKTAKGYFKYLWFEELTEFESPEKVRSIQQSILRGGPHFIVFYTFNPPQSKSAWVNDKTKFDEPNMLTVNTTYLDVPKEWLGDQFFIEAGHLKKVNPKAYDNEYLGKATGTGGEIFNNVKLREVSDNDILDFPRFRYGIDWGYTIDPFVFLKIGYDRKKRRILIFDEIYGTGIKNNVAAKMIIDHKAINKDIRYDSAEKKSGDEINDYGLHLRPCKKYPGSVDYGTKWLQDLDEIIIDPKRCPNAAREFYNYEYPRDVRGEFKHEYPDKDNHTIDAARYALEDDMVKVKVI